MVGIDRLLDIICDVAPSPLERPPARVRAPGANGGEVVEVATDPAAQPLAWVFKTIADPYVGKISLFKVLSGTVRPDAALFNPRARAEERLHLIFTLRGKEQIPLTEVAAGDFGAVAKLAATATGDTLAPRNMPVSLVPTGSQTDGDSNGPSWLAEATMPVLSVAIRPKSKADEDKMMTALHRLQEEDPTLIVRRDDETHQTVLTGTGETHIAIAMERLARKFGVGVESEELVIPYRETVTANAEAEGKYKKQTGGHGQFGVASLRIEPMDRGAGFEFVDNIVGGVIPRQYIPAVQKGADEAMSEGGTFGWPVVDIRVTCFDGKFHPVDSSEMSFKMAGALALREALAKASPVVLEPLSLLEVTVPNAYQGDVMGDLNSRRGRVQGTETGQPGESVVIALVPATELVRYAIELRSLTGYRLVNHAGGSNVRARAVGRERGAHNRAWIDGQRAADALEKLTRRRSSQPDPVRDALLVLLQRSWKAPLIGLFSEATENKLRWCLAPVLPRLTLTISECRRVAEILRSYLEDQSSIVKTCALQGLADLTRQNASLLPEVIDLLQIHSRSGTPAMRARCRILLRKLEAAPKFNVGRRK